MQSFLNPKSIAIIGASETKNKIGNILLENLSGNKKIKIFPINPSHQKIGSLKCFSSVLDIEEKIDLAVIAIPAKFVPKTVEECAWKSQPIRNIIIISAGFSEAGQEGEKLEENIKELANKYKLNILGPNCLGIINAKENINVSFAKKEVKKGDVGLVMQSGAFTTALLDIAEKNNFGFSSIITLGNKTCLDEIDFMDYFTEDKNTSTVVFYLENIKKGREFREELKKLAKQKEVIVLKAGNSEKVKNAIQSHTGAMAGEVDIIKEVIRESGAIFIDNISNLVNIVKIFSGFRNPENEKVVIVTNAGGPGVIVTDAVEGTDNLKMRDFSKEEKEKLKIGIPPAGSAQNPIDILGDADSERYETALNNINKLKNIGSVFVLVTPQAQTDVENIAQVIIDANKKFDFPIFPIIIAGKAKKGAKEILAKNSFSNFDYPEQLISALDKIISFGKNNFYKIEIKQPNKKRIEKAEKIINNEKDVLYFGKAGELCQLYKIDTLKAKIIEDQKDIISSNWSFPVVLKVDSQKILHKKAQGGVILNIENVEDLMKNYSLLSKKLKTNRFVAQPQIEYKLEIILGIKDDPSFGKVVMVGLGGIFTEIINQKEIILLPTNRKIIQQRLGESSVAKILEKEGINLEILIDEVEKISTLASEIEGIKELDINPLVFAGGKPKALDIKIILK